MELKTESMENMKKVVAKCLDELMQKNDLTPAETKAAIDGLPCEKPDKPVGEGAKISVRGLGKIKLHSINGRTKKDRISVVIHRYV